MILNFQAIIFSEILYLFKDQFINEHNAFIVIKI